MSWTNIWLLLWWLGMFLFGMYVFEDAIKNLTTKTFKKILRNFTQNRLKSIFTWAFVTAILQSSSVVSLIVLAFVWAGVVGLQSAVWIIIWANVWAPLTDVLLGTIWLKYNIITLALVMVGFWWLWLVLFRGSNTWKNISKICIWLGIIFLWLGYLKESMMSFSHMVDLAQYASLHYSVFFVVWLFLTILIQSSGATIAIALSAGQSWLISLPWGMALIMWAFLWTTITVVLWAIWQHQIKKQVALSHVLFNVLVALVWFVFFAPMVRCIRDVLGFDNDIVSGLAVFALWFKFFVALLLFPFVGKFTQLIQKIIPEKKHEFNLHIEKIDMTVPELCIEAMRYDAIKLMKKIFKYNLNVFDIDESSLLDKNFEFDKVVSIQKEFEENNLDQQYLTIKSIEEKIITFGLHVKARSLSLEENQSVDALYKTISSEVSSAKYIKDIRLNVQNLQDSENSFMLQHYSGFRTVLVTLYKHISFVIDGQSDASVFSEITKLVKEIQTIDRQFLSSLSKWILSEHMDSLELAWLINVNRYVYLSSLSLVFALRDLFLTSKENAIFEELENS